MFKNPAKERLERFFHLLIILFILWQPVSRNTKSVLSNGKYSIIAHQFTHIKIILFSYLIRAWSLEAWTYLSYPVQTDEKKKKIPPSPWAVLDYLARTCWGFTIVCTHLSIMRPGKCPSFKLRQATEPTLTKTYVFDVFE